LGFRQILVKDEAHRFGLRAFKALGSTYACFRYLKRYLESDGRGCPPAAGFYRHADLLTPDEITFCTATDGNHGRGVAWTAKKLRQKAVIYMPAGTVPARIENIRNEGAEVIIVDGDYESAVSRCADEAAVHAWQIISDTSWPGYEEIPGWIQAGYLTMFREIDEAVSGEGQVDLVLVQGGVGALAAAAAWYYRRCVPLPGPKLVAVEPVEAACLLESIESPNGEPILARGRQDSIMAGLNCGRPSLSAWPFIKQGFDGFLTVSDEAAAEAMRTFYYPSKGDPRTISGESGAAGLAGLTLLAQEASMQAARRQLGLDRNSVVVLLNTEGNTDPEGFDQLVRGTPR
jgi:diaminopropionate ammonia-lyase